MFTLIACSGKYGEVETVLGTWNEVPGTNLCASLLQQAKVDCGHVLCPDGTQIRRYADGFDKWES